MNGIQTIDTTRALRTSPGAGLDRGAANQSTERSGLRGLKSVDPQAAAGQAVAELAFKPLLAQLREEPFGKGLFDSRTEEVFGEKLDERFADQVAQSATGLRDSIARLLVDRDTVSPTAQLDVMS